PSPHRTARTDFPYTALRWRCPIAGSEITNQGSRAMTTISSPDFSETHSIYADYCYSSSSSL
ncbi:MAG: hypothetical protein WA977_01260, partial [Halobacteriota archaeon]